MIELSVSLPCFFFSLWRALPLVVLCCVSISVSMKVKFQFQKKTPLFTSFATSETTHYHYFQETTKLANCYHLTYSISLPYPLTNILIIFPPHPRHEILIHNPHLLLQLIFFQCLLLTFSTLLRYRLCDFVTFKVIICSLPCFYFSYKIINKIFYYHLFLDLQRHK